MKSFREEEEERWERKDRELDEIIYKIDSGLVNQHLFIAKAHAPYDGCWWEWVYALVHEGKLLWAHDPRNYRNYQWHKDDLDREVLRNLTDWDLVPMDKLFNNIPGAAVKGLLEFAEDNDIHWFSYPCSECKTLLNYSEEVFYHESDYRSLGGIVISAGEPLCQECYDNLEMKFWKQEVLEQLDGDEKKAERYFEMARYSNYDRMTPESIDEELIEEIRNTLYLKSYGENFPYKDEDNPEKKWQTLWTDGKECMICGENTKEGDLYCTEEDEFCCFDHAQITIIKDPNQIELEL